MYSLWKIFRPIARLPYALIIAFKRHIRINKIDYDGKYKEEIKNLSKKGYTTFQHLVSSFDLEELIKIDTKLSSSISKSGHPGYVRLHNIHTDNPLPNSLLNLCQKFANEYFKNCSPLFESTQYQISWHDSSNSLPGLGYHVDDFGKILKFFIFFTKVSNRNGPFRIIKASRSYMSLIKGIRWIWLTNLKDTYFEIDKIPKKLLKQEETILCNPMSIYAVDTSSLHTASPVIDGNRRVMVLTFRDVQYEI